MKHWLVPFSALLFASQAQAQTISWASKPADADVNYSGAVLGPPDGKATAVDLYGFAYVRDFQPGAPSAASLERALKLPAGELARWDLIAFEGKSAGENAPYDGSMWMVQDLQKMVSVVYDSKTGSAVPGTGTGWAFRTGVLTSAEYKALFPVSRYPASVGWLLIRLPAGTVDKRSPNLAVWLGGGPLGSQTNSPAPDAIGVIR